MKITIKGKIALAPTHEELEREVRRLQTENLQLKFENRCLFDMVKPLFDETDWHELEHLYLLRPITDKIQ